jgi:ribosomal-protein-alanine N-acetyltransferase
MQIGYMTMIRLATVEDIPELLAIEAISFQHGRWKRSQFYRLIQYGKGKFWVYELYKKNKVLFGEFKLLGYLYITPQGRILSIASISKIGGVGSALLQVAEEYCRFGKYQVTKVGNTLMAWELTRTGIRASTMRLEVCVLNQNAIRFYEKHGFKLYGRKENYYSNGETALLYKKELSNVQPSDTL